MRCVPTTGEISPAAPLCAQVNRRRKNDVLGSLAEPANSLPEVSPDGHAAGGREVRLLPGSPPLFHTSTSLRRHRRGRAKLNFLRGWDGDGTAHGAATMLCRVQADFPIRELRCHS